MVQGELFNVVETQEIIHSSNLSLSERIQNERIAKQPSQPFSIKQLSKMKIRYDLAIQRNIRWSEEQATKLIESCFLGFPIPPVYALRSIDKELWLLDGKQRLSFLTGYFKGEWELTECIVYGVDITGLKFSQLPEELQELIIDQYINVIQFDSLTTEQRDSLFQRLNSGTSLTSVEYLRSVLGSDMLDYIAELTKKPLFRFMNTDKFIDEELCLQLFGVITGELFDFNRKSMLSFAIELRSCGLSDETKIKIETILDYVSEAFSHYEEKEQKKLLKKNDIVGLVGAAKSVINKVESKTFGGITASEIIKKIGAYKETKLSGSASESKVKARIKHLVELFG